jgi:hypothetical protein
MTIPHSEPVVPAQPKQYSYGFGDLALFKTFTRESFRAAFGTEAPPYDPSRLIKTWFDTTVDTSDAANIVVYKVISADSKGQWGVRQMVMPAREAATVNLPGAVSYPEYVIVPTKAARGGVTGIWPSTLSLLSEAQSLLRELDLENVELKDEGEGSSLPVIYGDEPRRQWFFFYKGSTYSVGELLASKYRNGVGAPGRWVVEDTIQWLADPPAPTGLKDTRAPREIPVRDLLANEKIAMTLMGPVLVRADSPLDPSSQFTQADRSTLQEIQRLLLQLVSKG